MLNGLPISTVEQDWFRAFMKVVEPKFEMFRE